MSENYFVALSKVDVSEHIEKKGQFSYLSWAWAVDQLRRLDPEAVWEVKRFDGLPYIKSECGYFVEVAVTVKGVTLSQIHPVLDNRNKPIATPNSFQINTSIQRCLVKAIALHGLGLYIYAGEDLPNDIETVTSDQVGKLKTLILEFAQLRDRTIDEVYKAISVSDITKLTSQEADKLINTVTNWIIKAKKEME